MHQNSIKLADFGLSNEPGSIQTKKIFNMLPYIDPKSFDIDNPYKLGKKSDVYSVGMLLWQISSGHSPFRTQEYNAALVYAILGGQRETIVNNTPIGYSELYNECWKLEPDERPDMQRIVSILRTLINMVELPKISVIEDNEEIKNETTSQLVKKFLKDNNVNIIPFNELENPVPLCEGGFGDIKKAIWRNKYVVYKRLINTTIQYNTLNAFIHELKIHLLLLSSYNERIIHCFGVSQVDKTKEYLLVTQYADGGDLRHYLKKNFKKLIWDDKKKLAYQIADGLNYLHNENVLHRDLHSKNIVIHENNAKIIDFGISKIQDQKSEAYMRDRGIIAYMEPKRILDPNFPYTKSSDIYSFGVLMWEISSGNPPFKNNSFNRSDKDALVYAINSGVREKLIPGTPKEYEELYKTCWDQDPNQRPTTKKILYKFTEMGFGVVNASNIELKSDEEKSNKSNSDLQGDLFIKTNNISV
ncbi:kinase-like domain-containing protein [Rhizophagus diaphanus]|nr:kinase-like domain-containing protein [Rhizophagus diaphanus] [Rhizophagus sp. MUCL 43196]